MSLGWKVRASEKLLDDAEFLANEPSSPFYSYLEPSFNVGKFVSESMCEVAKDEYLATKLNATNAYGLPLLRKTLVKHLAEENINTNIDEIVLYPSLNIGVEIILKSIMRSGLRAYVTESEHGELYPLLLTSMDA